MARTTRTRPGLATLAVAVCLACAGGDGTPSADSNPDVSTQPDVPPEGPAPDPSMGELDTAFDEGPDPVGDVADANPEPAPDAPEEAPGDAAPEAPDVPPPEFCRSFEDCAAGEVCVFSLGLCQLRASWTDSQVGLYGFHPTAAAPGDRLILDGKKFSDGMMGLPTVQIGTVKMGGFSLVTSENRIIVPVTAAMQGAIAVFDPAQKVATLPGPFLQAPKGVIPCDGTTPAATFLPGVRVAETGMFAAGYVDLADAPLNTRVFYPAQCGSIRRPPVAGTWPVVLLLHGNGAPHMNYEFLGELLATWGIVSAMPATQQNMAGEDFKKMLEELMPLVKLIRGRPLAGLHEVLAGVSTTESIAFVGHSRGSGRAEEVVGADADVKAHTVGAVFLGPVDDGDTVPGLFMVFGGLKDAQSGPLNYKGTYNQQPAPRWMIEFPGGNHGSMCDHKVYGYGIIGGLGDQMPTILRARQLLVIQQYALPLFQRAFGLPEPFASQLDAPPGGPDHAVTYDLGK